MDPSSSSKVTVEYRDPSGIFNLVQPLLAQRLPLRNLNWQSPSRPLRQIKRLYIDFIPDHQTQNDSQPAGLSGEGKTEEAQVQDQDDETAHATSSLDIVRSGATVQRPPRTTSRPERRHQIPGLKSTPYLRIYLLRCDDKDTYKSSERNKLHEWLRQQAKPTSAAGSKGKKHDSSEWMILHVVIPDTLAASEPRWRLNTTDGLDQRHSDEIRERPKSSAKWPGKSTRTVFDKLRADFNESSKSSPDRVAQVRLQKEDVPPDLLPTPAVATTIKETQQERESAWNDLVSKLKFLILASFDVRVRQYEQDVAEREAQRSLPGWNFNTFFILKEGLARGLESVGLVEDALAIYDELAVGLESVLRDLTSGKSTLVGSATTFAEFTPDIRQRILTSSNDFEKTKEDRKEGSHDTGVFSKDYRASIVTSSISVFDFYCYLFQRQKTLMLRIANSTSSRGNNVDSSSDFGGERAEDLVKLSDVARRSMTFLHNSARSLRQDLEVGYAWTAKAQISRFRTQTYRVYRLQKDSSPSSPKLSIDLLVSAWSYIVAEQSFLDTETSIPVSSQASHLVDYTAKNHKGLKRSQFSFGAGGNAYPQRSSSLGNGALQRQVRSTSDLTSPRHSVQLDPNGAMSPPPSRSGDQASEKIIPGYAELCACRAELSMAKRKALVTLGSHLGFDVGWSNIKKSQRSLTDPADTTDIASKQHEFDSNPENARLHALLPANLRKMFNSAQSFCNNYQSLSELAVDLYRAAGRSKSAELIISDLAVLKFQQSDFASAANLWQQILPSYATHGWAFIEAQAIDVYAQCLSRLGQNEAYVRTVLALIAKIAERRRETSLRNGLPHARALEASEFDTAGMLQEVVTFSRTLSETVITPLEWYFNECEVELEVMHLDDARDGFKLRVRLQHTLDDNLQPDEARIRLLNFDDPSLEIWLVSTSPPTLKTAESVFVELISHDTAFGPYLVDRVTIKVGGIIFERDMRPKQESGIATLGIPTAQFTNADAQSLRQPFVFLYPPSDSLWASLQEAKNIHLDKPRTLQVKVQSGRNEVRSMDVRLKPATAGLRLHLAEFKSQSLHRKDAATPSLPGVLVLGELGKSSEGVLEIPYSLEQSYQSIDVKIEIRYTTEHGTFVFHTNDTIQHELPLDVDVNDVFCNDFLLSTFSIRTARGTPLQIYSAQLLENPAYAVEGSGIIGMPRKVFEQRSAKTTYKITRKGKTSKLSREDSGLVLTLAYLPNEELYILRLLELFGSSLRTSKFHRYQKLFSLWLEERARRALSRFTLESAMLSDTAPTPSFDECAWQDIVDVLSQAERQPLLEMLKQWHLSHKLLDMSSCEQNEKPHQRHITLSVEVPAVDVAFSTSIQIIPLDNDDLAKTQNVVVLGMPVKAEVSLRYTRSWFRNKTLGDDNGIAGGQRFSIYIQADSDVWIVGGCKKSQFILPNHDFTSKEPLKFEVTLVPIREGQYVLPTVEVSPLPPEDASEDGDKTRERLPSCENHFVSAATIVQVIRGESRARVFIPETPPVTVGDGRGSERPSTSETIRDGS